MGAAAHRPAAGRRVSAVSAEFGPGSPTVVGLPALDAGTPPDFRKSEYLFFCCAVSLPTVCRTSSIAVSGRPARATAGRGAVAAAKVRRSWVASQPRGGAPDHRPTHLQPFRGGPEEKSRNSHPPTFAWDTAWAGHGQGREAARAVSGNRRSARRPYAGLIQGEGLPPGNWCVPELPFNYDQASGPASTV